MSRYFIYTRKSTESEDRQTLSLGSQQDELTRFAQNLNLDIQPLAGESKSAKQPGRPIFNEMIDRVQRGEADGIIAWHPDRLARNAVDGGLILHMLDSGQLKDLKFPNFTFENNPQGKFMLGILFSQSKYYVDSMSENVKRGLRTKVRMGWLPAKPPLGYLNDPATKKIIRDPERFELVKLLWDTFLAGRHSLDGLVKLGTSLGLSGRFSKGKGTGGLNRTTIYDMLSNPFYAGRFVWKGELHEGSHEAMIDQAGFERAQAILRGRGHPRPKLLNLPYRGLIECGGCGHKVTAERKTHPRTGRKYLYFRCAIQRRGCSEPSLEIRQLEQQLEDRLGELKLPAELFQHVARHLDQLEAHDGERVAAQLALVRKQVTEKENGLNRLLQLRLREVLSDEEYVAEKNRLIEAKARLQDRINNLEETNQTATFDDLKEDLAFNQRAVASFQSGTHEERYQLISAICSNLVLKQKNLLISAKFPHNLVWSVQLPASGKTCSFEPAILGQDNTKNAPSEGACPVWLGLVNNVRTKQKPKKREEATLQELYCPWLAEQLGLGQQCHYHQALALQQLFQIVTAVRRRKLPSVQQLSPHLRTGWERCSALIVN